MSIDGLTIINLRDAADKLLHSAAEVGVPFPRIVVDAAGLTITIDSQTLPEPISGELLEFTPETHETPRYVFSILRAWRTGTVLDFEGAEVPEDVRRYLEREMNPDRPYPESEPS